MSQPQPGRPTIVMQGHRTTRALLPQLDPAQAKAVREGLGWTE